MKGRVRVAVALLVSTALFGAGGPASGGATGAPPYLASGVKVGEVGPNEAIVWVRLTAQPERNDGGRVLRAKKPKQRPWPRIKLPAGLAVGDLQGACPGAPGEARVLFSTDSELEGATVTPWRAARAKDDFVLQFRLAGLEPGTRYHYRVETRRGASATSRASSGSSLTGSFRTAWATDKPGATTFTVVTGQMFRDLDDPRGFLIYEAMSRLEPEFLVATGDTVYYDSEGPIATSVELARYHWHRMYSLPRLVAFHRRVPGYWIKDDHDALRNDCWPGMEPGPMAPFTFAEGQRVFREQAPMGQKTYRSFRWGQLLEVWLVEGRDFRSPNTMPDGPQKTIWGDEQKRWLKKSLLGSDAVFRVLVSATPIVGPDRKRGKRDNHSNAAFRHAGDEFRGWVQAHLPERFYVVCGDRHWQYHSADPATGVQEFSCGPASDEHAGGSPGHDPSVHRFHRVAGGFLSVSVARETGASSIAFRFHGVDGQVSYEHREVAFDPPALQVLDRRKEPARKALYEGLLEEAREKLRERAKEVAALTNPSAVRARQERVVRTLENSFGGFSERTPLKPRTVGRIERPNHVVEKVIFESRPGFHVTANLYLPKGGAPHAVVLLPCGHSRNGKAGSTYQTAAQEFARRGLAVFVYDPVGQGERYQFLDSHGRPIIGGTTEHTVTGVSALLVGSNTAEVRIWDGIRAVDYLATRDDIDLGRLGVTGNSGGGTLTSYLMALEPRVRSAAPSCYLTSMQRLLETIGPQDAEQNILGFIAEGLDHADFVHAFAPRPALICAATDDFFDIGGTWTTFREAKRLYGRLGKPEALDLIEVDGKHGYHPSIRQAVGRFFERVLLERHAGMVEPTVQEGTVYPDQELQCTSTGQVLSALRGRSIADLWREEENRLRGERERRFQERPRAQWLEEVRRLAGMAKAVDVPRVHSTGTIAAGDVVVEKLYWEEPFPVAVLLFRPAGPQESGRPIEIHAHQEGKAVLATALAREAGRGKLVLAVDLPGFGETFPGTPRSKGDAYWGADWKHAFLAFHLSRSLVGIRADALRQAVAYARALPDAGPLQVTGVGRAAVPALLGALLEPEVGRLRLERGLHSYASIVESGLNHGRLAEVVPGALKHFDLPQLRQAMGARVVEVVEPVGPRDELLRRTEL